MNWQQLFQLDWSNLSALDIINIINIAFTGIFTLMLAYKVVFIFIGFLPPRHYKKSEVKEKTYAFLIAARNEELVIDKLLDSIKKQDYPSEKITIFVVADNCSDKTKQIAESYGAIVYERSDPKHARKGYALEYLTNMIDKDYGIHHFDAYLVFDADNLLKNDYVSRINDVFMQGHKIITSYRNVKNFDHNSISASYGIHQHRTLRTHNNPRTMLNLGCVVTGTGFMVASDVLDQDGWKWTLLNEDLEFTIDAASRGYRAVYCADAIFFDEQPTTLKVMMRQRLRWAKGFLQVLVSKHNQLLHNIFSSKRRTYIDKKQSTLTYRFMQYDLYWHLFPYGLITFFWKILFYIVLVSVTALTGGNAITLMTNIGIDALVSLVLFWIIGIIQILPVVILEWKQIYAYRIYKILFMFTFPLFDIVSIPLSLMALFMPPEWKRIVHEDTRTIEVVDDFFTSEEKRREARRLRRAERRNNRTKTNG